MDDRPRIWTDTVQVGSAFYHVLIRRRDGGYMASCDEFEGVEVAAHSPVSVMSEIRMAIVQVLAAMREAEGEDAR